MELINRLCNSILFWTAWIIIPVLMEIIPSLGSVIVLIKKHIVRKKQKVPAIFPEISLIIPIYNSMDTLEQCITSIANSDYPNAQIRVFLVNNQGQDDSFHVFSECQKKYSDLPMQWLNAQQGKSKALNMALFNSEGKYIIHIDSDGLLEKSALKNMVFRFENDPSVECMSGVILTDPSQVQEYPLLFPRLLRKLEFMEYAQAFLAGRNYASETNSVYTVSGAFSAFRKSAVLKSQMYNTDTICEDTQITFQMKYLLNTKVSVCEDAIFFVDPIESMNKLYTQRQRWQRGSLEVSHLFLKKKMKVREMFTNVGVRTLLYDHTFAFPRLIWYLALFCLLCMRYSYQMILFSVLFIYGLYVMIGLLYYISTVGFLKPFEELQKYYRNQWYVIFLLPVFNLFVFFIRFVGIINSINTDGAWKVANFSEEMNRVKDTISKDFRGLFKWIRRQNNSK